MRRPGPLPRNGPLEDQRGEAPSTARPDLGTVAVSALTSSLSPRRRLDEEHVRRLSEIVDRLPPILVHRDTLRVVDGVHRLQAATRRGHTEIEVRYFDGDLRDAFLCAVSHNVTHGLPLCLADRKAAAERIIVSHPWLSDREIARHAGLAAKTVAAIRTRSTEESQKSNTRLGADGRVRPLNGKAGRNRAAEAIARHPGASLREIARIAGVSLGTVHDVRRRLDRGEDPLPARQRRTRDGGQNPTTTEQPPARDDDAPNPETAPIACPAGPAEDPLLLLRKIAKDPALRNTVRGRELLRLLNTWSTAIENWTALVEAVPPYQATTVATIARLCEESWNDLARALEDRSLAAD
ncbi:transcriptional regulator [Actinomadura sp. KC06]|uniref:ParB/RepB/Spo0J family partition protein n=1 Tax=Actinomadura sp. KC06 TaxID=2530369 RepID=UPI00104384F8|nr:ParB/RepB/Spo0J family partition protein [Actinomadura sp. KC06]TDD35500.1 transcriptional regulator [Actinomadura sp. KC06]